MNQWISRMRLQPSFSQGASTFGEEMTIEVQRDMCTDPKESLRIFLTQQLRDVEEDIETISGYISFNPPDTSGEPANQYGHRLEDSQPRATGAGSKSSL